MKEAKEKVWATQDNRLVEDGHKDAAILVAAKGQLVPDEYVKSYKGGGDFFKDVTRQAPEPNIPAPRIEKFEPGQSNSEPVAGAPQETVSEVRTIGDRSAVDKDKQPDITATPKPEDLNVRPTAIHEPKRPAVPKAAPAKKTAAPRKTATKTATKRK